MGLSSRFPARKILELLRSQTIDRQSERAQFQTRDFNVNFRWQEMHAGIELAFVLHQIFYGESLVSKAHVHTAGRVAFGGGEIDQTALAQNHNSPPVLESVFLDKRTHLCWLAGQYTQA